MKKKVLLIFLLVLVSSLLFVSAQNQTQSDVATKGYDCLENKVANKCSTLSTEEKIFSALALGRCKAELNSDSLNSNECWPNSGCTIKTTAQAILAVGSGTKKAEDWLLSQAVNFNDIFWYLQIESPTSNGTTTACRATYAGVSYDFSISADRTLTTTAGGCLTRYQNYWFTISPSCYNEQFQITCDKSFLTSLLYKKNPSAGSTFYVSEATHSASGSGTTIEKVNSMCFTEGTSCSYEGTLWAALVLKNKKYNITAYLPYLVSQADENSKYIPEAFLYSLTNGFKTALLSKQIGSQYWDASGDKFYDTAAALLPFQNVELTEKTNSKNWLKEVQDAGGCWQDNIRNTAFILYSLWPRKVSGEIPDTRDCEAADFYCMSAASCESSEGTVLDSYTGCFSEVCCNKPKKLESCDDQGGELCNSNEQCLDGIIVESLDTNSQKFCCTKGICGQAQLTQCETNKGICRTTCTSKEKLGPYTCSSSDICCVPKTFNWIVLIIILAILIILAVIGIIYRKQLRVLFMKFKTWLQSKFRRKGKPSAPSGRMTTPSTRVPPGAIPRRIIPQQSRATAKTAPKKTEFDDVIKKLREIGK
ncbi:MAG: hypothetical protein PHQ66_03445 [Candidatus Nanoarchaeia archaeon]|nr:hypothetical protein [Candidatus Nanoarchaeia archaeon]MDD5357583.1 hypothetical protein [Candidatus Nanoarchaeia archaeon]MDD5588502.1 hypothetical protein [Candidatus Nanoarchaeia archaeon]